MKNSIKWGMVTFCSSITCATIAHYVPAPEGGGVAVFLAFVFSAFSSLVIGEEQREN